MFFIYCVVLTVGYSKESDLPAERFQGTTFQGRHKNRGISPTWIPFSHSLVSNPPGQRRYIYPISSYEISIQALSNITTVILIVSRKQIVLEVKKRNVYHRNILILTAAIHNVIFNR